MTFATNKDGTKIFCRFTLDKKTLIKGFYDFNRERFYITDYVKKNFTKGIGRDTAREKLKEILLVDYDWEI